MAFFTNIQLPSAGRTTMPDAVNQVNRNGTRQQPGRIRRQEFYNIHHEVHRFNLSRRAEYISRDRPLPSSVRAYDRFLVRVNEARLLELQGIATTGYPYPGPPGFLHPYSATDRDYLDGRLPAMVSEHDRLFRERTGRLPAAGRITRPVAVNPVNDNGTRQQPIAGRTRRPEFYNIHHHVHSYNRYERPWFQITGNQILPLPVIAYDRFLVLVNEARVLEEQGIDTTGYPYPGPPGFLHPYSATDRDYLDGRLPAIVSDHDRLFRERTGRLPRPVPVNPVNGNGTGQLPVAGRIARPVVVNPVNGNGTGQLPVAGRITRPVNVNPCSRSDQSPLPMLDFQTLLNFWKTLLD